MKQKSNLGSGYLGLAVNRHHTIVVKMRLACVTFPINTIARAIFSTVSYTFCELTIASEKKLNSLLNIDI